MAEWLGKTIGNVRIEKYLARGGMAEVYLGTHLKLERPVAVKVMHGYIEEDQDLIARFHREAKVVAGLRHPNIVQIYDFDAIDGSPYIVMEYLKGPTLANYLRAIHSRNERIPQHQVARLLKGITAGLDYAHGQGVIHRDVKPGNIILQSITTEITIETPLARDVEGVLTDFGLVRIANSATQTASGSVSGTAAYMSPEQARGDKPDYRTDIYSLGIVLYEMLAGRVPFEADSTLSVMYKQINDPPPPIKGISPSVQAVMDRALMKKPEDRYQTSREMAVDFFMAIGMNAEAETILNASQLTLEPAKVAKKTSQPRSSKWTLPLAGIGIACLILLAVGAFLFRPYLTRGANVTDTVATQLATDVPNSPVPTESPLDLLPDSANMIQIPAGSYIVGREPADDYHSAVQTIQLQAFWIDEFQVTDAQYQEFMGQTGALSPMVTGVPENYPVRGVTWDQANSYCVWKMKRLPAEAEWEAAGRGGGPNPQLYPWGEDASLGNKLPDTNTYEVGTNSFNTSPFGVYDLVGNVWEWVEDPYAFVQEGYYVLRGGRYSLPQDLAYRLVVAPDSDYITYAGFRCAADQVK